MKTHRILKITLLAMALLLVIALAGAWAMFGTQLTAASSIEKLDEGLWAMEYQGDYGFDEYLKQGGATSDAEMGDYIASFLSRGFWKPDTSTAGGNYGCSTLAVQSPEGAPLFGRNFDWEDCDTMLIHTVPKDGYESISTCCLDFLGFGQDWKPDGSMGDKFMALAAVYVPLDGMNEKGVSIAVLTLDSEPVHQNTGRPVIGTTLVIRLILDRAATTEEAIELLNQYDMFATSGRDYHFYITDASGDGRVVEYDCESETREMVATPIRSITNFFGLYEDKVLPNQKNGIYGHGKERYDKMEAIFDYEEVYTSDVAWEALKAASQEPSEEEVTSNTQWSIVYDDTNLTAEIALRRNWDDVIGYNLKDNTITLK